MARLTNEEILMKLTQLDRQVHEQLPGVLSLASFVLGRELSIHQFHAIIGAKNNLFVNVATGQYTSPEAFQTEWAEKMIAYYEPYSKAWQNEEDWPNVVRLYRNDTIRQYILLFQERNYYRWYKERIRCKPGDSLWVLWFGDRPKFGLYVALVYESDGTFRFKEREIRKVSYEYWTIGNVLGVGGFVNAETGKLYTIKSIDDLLNFYENIIYSLSRSQYEKAIYLEYIDYLKRSSDVMSEPFLIPELRYEGTTEKHKYRLDLAICNPYTTELVGFELSPSSTHMSIIGVKNKTQADINRELAEKWEKECDKRNEYFKKYGITIVTFTDTDLQDIGACFETIKIYLQKRPYVPCSLQESINKLDDLMSKR